MVAHQTQSVCRWRRVCGAAICSVRHVPGFLYRHGGRLFPRRTERSVGAAQSLSAPQSSCWSDEIVCLRLACPFQRLRMLHHRERSPRTSPHPQPMPDNPTGCREAGCKAVHPRFNPSSNVPDYQRCMRVVLFSTKRIPTGTSSACKTAQSARNRRCYEQHPRCYTPTPPYRRSRRPPHELPVYALGCSASVDGHRNPSRNVASSA